MTRRRLLAGTSALIGGVFLLLVWQRTQAPSASVPNTKLEHRAQSSELGESDVRDVRAMPAAVVTPAVASVTPASESPEAEPPQAEAPAPDELPEKLEAKLAAETSDPNWSSRMAAALSGALETALPRSKIVDASCRTSLCRVSVTHQNAEAEEEFVAALPHLRPFATHGLIRQVGSEENPRSVVYVAREGQSLR